MPKIIIKVPNIKGKSASAGLINYIAKREGVDKSVNQKVHVGKPSKNQMKYIEEILNLCPDAKDTYEYQDYISEFRDLIGFENQTRKVHFSVSLGYMKFNCKIHKSIDELIIECDKRMYRNKRKHKTNLK